jgi:hypothetical protein
MLSSGLIPGFLDENITGAYWVNIRGIDLIYMALGPVVHVEMTWSGDWTISLKCG